MRPAVFENVLRSIRDQETVHEIAIVCAISPDDPYWREQSATCKEYDAVAQIPAQNLPLSNKANSLCNFSRQLDWDYLMILGSDDVVGPGFFDAYDEHLQPVEGTFAHAHEALSWGWSDLYMWEPGKSVLTKVVDDNPNLVPEVVSYTGRFVYWPGYNPIQRDESIGAGRILRRDVVERLDWQLYDEGINKNLDASMTARLKAIGVTVPHGKLPEGVYLVDCKDEVSITKLSQFEQGVLVDMAVPDVLRGYL